MRLLLVAVVLAACAQAQETPAGAHGVVLEVRGAAGAQDACVTPLVALRVEDGASPSPFVAPGPFEATFRGVLDLAVRDRYAFAVEGTGTATLQIDGEPVAFDDDVRLRSGSHPFEVRYQSPPHGAAWLRLTWRGSDFDREPVPPERLFHDPDDPALVAGAVLRRGRALLAERGCVRCHALDEDPAAAPASMPELAMRPPELIGTEHRLRRDWLRRWLLDPETVRPDATMPSMLHGDEAERDARDLAVFLAQPDQKAEKPRRNAVHDGGVLFAELGCIGCHTRPDADDDPQRIALRSVAAKFQPGALARYLREPQRHRPRTRMPDFDLGSREASALEAWLRSVAPASEAAVDGDAERGRMLLAERGCLQCHEGPDDTVEAAATTTSVSPHAAPPPVWSALADWHAGCLADDPSRRGTAPAFVLSEGDRHAIRTAAPRVDTLRRRAPAETARRLVEALRCTACHARDGEPATGDAHLDEVADLLVGREPAKVQQRRPELTWVGEKLRVDWTRAFLGGELDTRPRPWLRARMPAFPAWADALAVGLAAQHGMSETVAEEPPPDPNLVPIGERLVGANGGFGCVTCHAVAGTPPTAVFEVEGVDLALSAQRLRKDWFLRWLRDPLRIDPATKMPRFSNAQGKTGFVDVFDGDAHRQYEAIWQYLRTLPARR